MFTTKPIAELPEHLQYLHGNRKQEYNDIADALNNVPRPVGCFLLDTYREWPSSTSLPKPHVVAKLHHARLKTRLGGLYVELQPGEVSTPNLRFRLINAMQCRGLRIAVKQVGDKVLVIKK